MLNRRGARGGKVRGGRGGARRQPEQLEAQMEQVSMPATVERTDWEASTESFADHLARVRRQQALAKKRVAALAPVAKQRLQEQIARKEVARFLMVDAPERKRRQLKPSPERDVCPLAPGTPSVPPPKKRQPWELAATAATTARDEMARRESGNMLAEATTQGEREALNQGDLSVEDVEIEWVGFTPTSTRSPSGRTSQPSSPVAGPSRAPMFESSLFTSFPVVGSSQTSTLELASADISDEDMAVGLGLWEHSVEPGSSDEEPDYALAPADPVFVDQFPAVLPEYLYPELSERIQLIEAREDAAFRGNVSDDLLHFDWRRDAAWFQGVREEFSGQAGPTFPLSDMNCPLDAFRKIWDDALMSLIVIETNRYAECLIRSTEVRHDNCLNRWKPLTTEELWVFLAVCMIQSLIPLPVEEEYWRAFVSFVSMQQFPQVMTFNRFKLIKRCLHFVDSDNIQSQVESPGSRKLVKIMPIIEHLNGKFSSLYYPGQEIALDESLLQWKGRLNFAQKIATKAAGVGFKSYELCESKTGYLWKFQIYTGKSSQDHVVEPTSQEEPDGMTSRIVYDLASPLFNRGHTLVMDNFYNSPLLSRCLKLKGMDTMGTLRINREFVPDSLKTMAKSQLRVGEFASSQTNDLAIVLWRDANVVALISSFHPVRVGGKEKYSIYKYKPQVVLDYNLAMGGIDRKDQLLSSYPIERTRNRVWYKKLFRRLLNISVLNASILYGYKANMTERAFRQDLVKSILVLFLATRTSSVPARLTVFPTAEANVAGRPNIIGAHYLEKGKQRGYCKLCRKRTWRQCEICKIPFCVDICFKKYHTR